MQVRSLQARNLRARNLRVKSLQVSQRKEEDPMRARHTALLIGSILAATALLSGCGSGDGSYSGDAYAGDAMAPLADGAMPEMAVEGDTAVGGTTTDRDVAAASAATQREVIRTAYVSLRVDDVKDSATQVRALAVGMGGVVSTESQTSDGTDGFATVTVQVPVDQLEPYLAAVSELGTVDSRTVTAEDVTLQVVDLDARIEALTTSITRLEELLARAETVEDLLAIETELARRQADLDALQAQRTWIGDQVAMSTVTVSLSPITVVTSSGAPGFLSGLESGWSAMVAAAGALITVAGFLLPFLLVLALIAIPVTFVIVRLTRRGRKVTKWASSEATDSDAVASSSSSESSSS